jgi:hypothetical protein
MLGSHGHGGDALVGLVTDDSRSSLEAESFAVSLASLRVKGRRAGEDCLFDCCAYASVEIADERERGAEKPLEFARGEEEFIQTAALPISTSGRESPETFKCSRDGQKVQIKNDIGLADVFQPLLGLKSFLGGTRPVKACLYSLSLTRSVRRSHYLQANATVYYEGRDFHSISCMVRPNALVIGIRKVRIRTFSMADRSIRSYSRYGTSRALGAQSKYASPQIESCVDDSFENGEGRSRWKMDGQNTEMRNGKRWLEAMCGHLKLT